MTNTKVFLPAASPGCALADRLEDLLVDEGLAHAYEMIHIMLVEHAEVGDLAALETMQSTGPHECRIDVPAYYSEVTKLDVITCRKIFTTQIGPGPSPDPESSPVETICSRMQASDLCIACDDLPDFMLGLTSQPSINQDVLVSTVAFKESASPRISSLSDVGPFDMELIRIQVVNAFRTLNQVGGSH